MSIIVPSLLSISHPLGASVPEYFQIFLVINHKHVICVRSVTCSMHYHLLSELSYIHLAKRNQNEKVLTEPLVWSS